MYWHTYDPFVALTAAAAVTTNLKLGTGICLMIERDPITTAKEGRQPRSHLQRAIHLRHRGRLER